MKKLVLGLASLPLLAGVAMAGQPASLTDAQMDKVTAGLIITLLPSLGFTTGPTPVCPPCVMIICPTCDGLRGFPTVTGLNP